MVRPFKITKHYCRLIICALAATGTIFALFGSAPGDSTTAVVVPWQITITFTDGSGGAPDTVKYDFLPKTYPPINGGCKEGPVNPGDPSDGGLQACPNDTVSWKLKTDSGDGHLIITQLDGLLGNAMVDADEGPYTTPSTIPPGAACADCKYFVFAYLKHHVHIYADIKDPKMIVGGSREQAERLLNQIREKIVRFQILEKEQDKEKGVKGAGRLLEILDDLKHQLGFK